MYTVNKHPNTDKGDIKPRWSSLIRRTRKGLVLIKKGAEGYLIQTRSGIKILLILHLILYILNIESIVGFQVEGDSMLPNFRPEDWVLARGVESLESLQVTIKYIIVTQDAPS
jgi:hypothetical protein